MHTLMEQVWLQLGFHSLHRLGVELNGTEHTEVRGISDVPVLTLILERPRVYSLKTSSSSVWRIYLY